MKKINIIKAPNPVYYFKHKSGLDVYCYNKEESDSFYVTLTTKFGSIHTSFKKMDDDDFIHIPDGTAHFLEHLTFKTEEGDAMEFFSNLGSKSNAYTTFEHTTYEVIGTNNIYDNINHLLNFVLTPFYNEELVERERGIIIEEALMGEDRPLYKTSRKNMLTLLSKSNYRNRVIGEVDDIKKISLEDITNAYSYFYKPSNMFLIVTGKCDPEKLEELINNNKVLNSFKEEENIIIEDIHEDESIASEKVEVQEHIDYDRVTITKKIPFNLLQKVIPHMQEDIYTELLMTLNFGPSSDFKEFCIDNKLTTYAPGYSGNKYGEYVVYGISAETLKREKFIKEAINLLNNLKIDKKNIIRKRNVAISGYIKRFDNIYSINEMIMDDLLDYNEIFTDRYNAYYNIDINILKRVANIINNSNILVTIAKKD